MRLGRSTAAALDRYRADVAVRQPNFGRTFARCREVDRQRSASIERAERAQPVAYAPEQDWEFGALHDPVFAFELGWRQEVDAQLGNCGWRRVQAYALHFNCAIDPLQFRLAEF